MKLSSLLGVVMVLTALGQSPGTGSGPGAAPSPPPVAAAPVPHPAVPNPANNLAQAIWLYLQGGNAGHAAAVPAVPHGMMAPPVLHGTAPPVAHGTPPPPVAPMPSSSSGPPAANPGPGDATAGEVPPWRRRSRSRVAAPVAAAPESTPPVHTPPAVAEAAPASAAPVVDLENETAAATPKAGAKKPLSLDLRYCRVCREIAYQGKSVCLNTECVPWSAL